MPFFGDALGAYMLPRVVLELLQQPGGQQQCGVCADSGFAWILSNQQLYIWRYREGKEARLRVLTLPRPPAPSQPCSVALIPHGTAALPSAAAPASLAGLMAPSAAAAPAAADGPLSVAVCDGDGRLTIWLDAHHLASPVEHQLLTRGAAPAVPQPDPAQPRPPLVAAFAATRLDLGSGPAFLAALSASDGSLHLLQVGSQGIFPKQLHAPAAAAESRGLVGALGSALSRAYTDAFDPSARYMRKAPSPRPALALHVAPAAGGGGQHYRLLVLTADTLDCWAVSVGLRPSESLQWSFLNGLVHMHDSGRGGGRGGTAGAVNLALAVAGQHVAVWMAETDRGPHGHGHQHSHHQQQQGAAVEHQQHVVQLLELSPEGGPGVVSGVYDMVEGYEEPAGGSAKPLRKLLYSPHSQTCLLARWQQQQPPTADGGAAGSRVCRALWSWNASTGHAAPLLEDPDTAALDAVPDSEGRAGEGAGAGRWIVLSATYGVVEISATAAAAAPTGPQAPSSLLAAAGVGGGLDPAAAIANLLDAVLSQATAITAAGGNLQPLVSGLSRRLGALGALGTSAGQATLAHYSTQLLDLLPKQWAGGSAGAEAAAAAAAIAAGGLGLGLGVVDGSVGGGVVSVAEQLAGKESRHALLLQVLALSGVLHALEPAVLRVLIENSEKLAVVVALHRLQAHQRDTHMAVPGAAGGEDDAAASSGAQAAAALLSRLVAEAGQESSAREDEVLSASEIFYSRPSVSVGHFMAALGRAADGVAAQAAGGLGNPGDRGLTSLRTAVRELGSLLAVAVNAAVGRREQLAAAFHLSCHDVAGRLGRPDWLEGDNTRAAVRKLVEAILAVRPSPSLPPDTAPHRAPAPDLSHTLFGATDVLLTLYAAAVSATRDAAPRAALVAEYRAVRGRYAEELLADARAEMAAAGAAVEAAGQRPGPPGQELLIWQLEALCRAHHCYPQLFEVCEALAAADPSQSTRLYTHMATQPPEDVTTTATAATPPGTAPSAAVPSHLATLATYVFGRLLADGRPADLLDLPQQFHAGITTFLQPRLPAISDLLATHMLRGGEFQDAAAVLQISAAGAGAGAGARKQAAGTGGEGSDAAAAALGGGCLGGHRRLLSVARLAARAGGAADVEAAAVLQLRLLGLQTRLGLPADGPPLEPAVLLEEALAAAAAAARSGTGGEKEAAVAAVEVLALMPAEARGAHASKWQLAWKAVYDTDPWDEIAAARSAGPGEGGGSGEEEWAAALAGTAVCRAAVACAGSDALGFGASVVDSAPLDQVARWLRTWALATNGANGGTGGAAAAAVAAAGERRVAAVMAALRLGVEGSASAAAASSADGAAAAAAAGSEGGPLDMILD